MYPTKTSLGWCGCLILRRHLLIAWERCHSPRNVGRPASGCMVVSIAVIASVVYFAIFVGGLDRMMSATTIWKHLPCPYY